MKKQFRLFDVYRCAATGEQSSIKGIKEYHAHQTEDRVLCLDVMIDTPATRLPVHWSGIYTLPKGEKQLRLFIKEVNKRLHNCRRPGPKKSVKHACPICGKEMNETYLGQQYCHDCAKRYNTGEEK